MTSPMTKHGTQRAAPDTSQGRNRAAQVEVVVSSVLGVVVAVALSLVASLSLALLVGWDFACVVYMTWIWTRILRQDADQTAHRATTTRTAR
jgi:uncharacterized membrane protein